MYENIAEDAMPPEMIFHSPQKCKQWIDEHMPGRKKKGEDFLEFKDSELEPKA